MAGWFKKILGKFMNGWDRQFTGAYPRSSGAKSAVAGGHPEDMNEMPATENPEKEGPIYDGTQLK